MAQEAKFYLLNYKSRKQDGKNFIEYIVKLVDADEVETVYSITDYYNDENEITETRIWRLDNNALEDSFINNDSKLGNKILSFVTNEHFYRGDTIEAMFVKEQGEKLIQQYKIQLYYQLKKGA